MSNELDDLINEQLQKDIDLDRRKKAVSEMDLTLKEHRVTRDLQELEKNKEELSQAKNIDYGAMGQENIDRLVRENDEYMAAAKNAMVFINKEFKKIVPYFMRNLILIGGDTGDGKSTCCSSLIYSTVTRKNPATGRSGRCLVLTNEEDPSDYYNRVTCLVKGWRYANHDQFTDEQLKTFREFIPLWAKGGKLTIISDTYKGVSGQTTSVEGIQNILESLIKDYENGKPVYDAVFLDYYQNVRYSKMDPKLDEFMCQRKLAGILDAVKLRYPGPIVVFAQMKKLVGEDDSTPFNVRLKGSKLICDKATFICELIPERQLLRSKWVVHKSRFTEAVGQSIYTGFDRGNFVEYDKKFIGNVAKIVERNLERIKEQELGIVSSKEDIIPKEDDDVK
jgi:hypothetical protein